VGFFARSAPSDDREQRFLEGFVSLDARLDYWAGEKMDDDSCDRFLSVLAGLLLAGFITVGEKIYLP